MLLMMIFFRAGRRIRIAFVAVCGISVYEMITSRTMKVIWDVYSVLLSYPYSGTTSGGPLIIIPSLWEEQGVDFPQRFIPFSSFTPVKTAFENF